MTLTSNPRNQPPSYAKCQADLHAARETIKGYEAASHQAMTMLAIAIATATADRLKSCEGLLREIEVQVNEWHRHAYGATVLGVMISPDPLLKMKRKIAALLGPATTEGGG